MQGCLLSMMYYAFYNALLIQVADSQSSTELTFVDDVLFLAVANTLQEAHAVAANIMEQ